MLYFTKLSLKEAENIKSATGTLSQSSDTRNKHIDPHISIIGTQVSNNHNTDTLAAKILIKILYNLE